MSAPVVRYRSRSKVPQQLELFAITDEGPEPTMPAASVYRFRPRTEVIGVRVPQEVADWIQHEADRRYISKSTFLLRIVTQYAMDRQKEKPGIQRKQHQLEVA